MSMSNFDKYLLLNSFISSRYVVYLEGVSCVGKTSLLECFSNAAFVHLTLNNDYGDNFKQDSNDGDVMWPSFLINYPMIEAVSMQAQNIDKMIVVDRGYISNILYKIIFHVMDEEYVNWEEKIKEMCFDEYIKLSSTIQTMETNTIVFVLEEECLPIVWDRMKKRATELDKRFLEKYETGPCNEDYFYLRVQNEVFKYFYSLLKSSNIKFIYLDATLNLANHFCFEIEEYILERLAKTINCKPYEIWLKYYHDMY